MLYTVFYSIYSTLQPILQHRKNTTCISIYRFYRFYRQPSVMNFVQFGGMFGADWPTSATTRPEFGAVFVANLSQNLPQIHGGFVGKFMPNILRCQSKQPIGPWAPVAPAVAP